MIRREVCTISAMNKLEALAVLELLKERINGYCPEEWVDEHVIVEIPEKD